MKKIRVVETFLLVVVALALSSLVTAEDTRSDASERRTVARALQKGGYVIYFRHAATEHSQTDSDRVNLSNCATQRNLSKQGREQAQAIGKAFKALGINVSSVTTSPYCRCIDMGKLAFGQGTVSNDLTFAISQNEEEAKRLATALRNFLATKPQEGTNTVLISHTANLKEATGVWPKHEAEAHVFEPNGDGTFLHKWQVLLEEWPELVKAK